VTDVTLITGASSELGGALLPRIAAAGGVVYAHCASGRERLEQRIAALKGPTRFVPLQADFSSLSQVEALIETIRSAHEAPNKIVHLTAAPLGIARFGKLDWDELEHDLHISLRSITLLCRTFLPALVQAGRAGRVVIVLSSVTLGVPPKGMSAYTTVKYALLGLTRALASEYADKAITVNAVSPYTMETPFLQRLPHSYAELSAKQNPSKRNATPADVVPAIELLLSDESGFITGANLPVTAGAAF
jgi:NAD(P)-dependent dehydrogenase (short-subunit alcohol dehydrogenase family)